MLEAESSLSKKLDTMLKDAKIDAQLMESLGTSIRGFEGAAKGIAPTAEAMTSTQRYSEEMALAAAQMESLNGLYKVQVETAGRQAAINNEVVKTLVCLKTKCKVWRLIFLLSMGSTVVCFLQCLLNDNC